MNREVKQFIEENINLIEQGSREAWEEIYRKLNTAHYVYTGEFTDIMLEAGINPLDRLNYIPENYLRKSNISGKFDIPSHIKSIGQYAFYSCGRLTNISIPDSVTHIDGCAFFACHSLANVTIGGSVSSIGIYVFVDCNNLASITIPNSVTSITRGAFEGCKKLKDIYYNGTKEQWENIDKEDWIPKYRNKTIHCSDGVLIEK